MFIFFFVIHGECWCLNPELNGSAILNFLLFLVACNNLPGSSRLDGVPQFLCTTHCPGSFLFSVASPGSLFYPFGVSNSPLSGFSRIRSCTTVRFLLRCSKYSEFPFIGRRQPLSEVLQNHPKAHCSCRMHLCSTCSFLGQANWYHDSLISQNVAPLEGGLVLVKILVCAEFERNLLLQLHG